MALTIGMQHSIVYKVEPKDSAIKVGSGLVDVFATPAMLALMEKTCSDCVKNDLEPGQVTVGMQVNLNHSGPSKIGSEVKCSCQLVNIDKRKLTFRVAFIDNGRLVGLASHTRCIVDKEKFMSKLNAA